MRKKRNGIVNTGCTWFIIFIFVVAIIQKFGYIILGFVVFFIFLYLFKVILSYLTKNDLDGSTSNTHEEPPLTTKQNDHNSDYSYNFSTSSNNDSYKNNSLIAPKIDQCEWIPSGQTVQIGRYIINAGMFYYGKSLTSVFDSYNQEPSLVDPNLSLSNKSNNSDLFYWPSYTDINPEQRTKFIEWMANGRNDIEINIGYVFIFFYGLERRALYDAPESNEAKSEIPLIINEIKKLLKIYGNNNSFNSYATSFLDFLMSKYSLYNNQDIDFINSSSMFLPFSIKKVLAEHAKSNNPIPAKLAFYWLENTLERPTRTPAIRCRKEYEKLFESRYNREYGNGLIIKPNKTPLSIEYIPASKSFAGRKFIFEISDLPDVTKLSTPITSFKRIADMCIDELDSYSRALGRKQDTKSDFIFSLAQLPTDLLIDSEYPEIIKLKTFLRFQNENNLLVINTSDLLTALGLPSDQSLTSQKSMTISQLIGSLGYGIEPDVRFGGNKITDFPKAVIFKYCDVQTKISSKEYLFTALLLSLASIVIHADGIVLPAEIDMLRSHVSSLLMLNDAERQRLNAHMCFLSIYPPSISSIKKRIEGLTIESKNFIVNFLITVANADGNISPDEIKILKKIYELFGLDVNKIYSDIHSLQTTGDEPVTIAHQTTVKNGFAIPKKEMPKEKSTITLNTALIERTLQQTNQVQALLSNIFSDIDETANSTNANKQNSNAMCICGLDENHSILFNNISGLESISVDEFSKFCKQVSVLPGGAVETINNAIFDKINELYIEEDGDMLILNRDLVKEMI